MKGTKFVGILLVATAMAMTAISLAPSRGLGKMASPQRDCNSATSEHQPLAKDESEKRILQRSR